MSAQSSICGHAGWQAFRHGPLTAPAEVSGPFTGKLSAIMCSCVRACGGRARAGRWPGVSWLRGRLPVPDFGLCCPHWQASAVTVNFPAGPGVCLSGTRALRNVEMPDWDWTQETPGPARRFLIRGSRYRHSGHATAPVAGRETITATGSVQEAGTARKLAGSELPALAACAGDCLDPNRHGRGLGRECAHPWNVCLVVIHSCMGRARPRGPRHVF